MVSSAVIAIAENTNHKLNRILKNTSVSLAVDVLFFYHTATLTCCVELMCRLCPERGGFCETLLLFYIQISLCRKQMLDNDETLLDLISVLLPRMQLPRTALSLFVRKMTFTACRFSKKTKRV